MKHDPDFMKKINMDLEARRIACKMLGFDEMAGKDELKKAYRKTTKEFHPDKHSDDPDANKKFALVKCAYELLAEDKPCPAILEKINIWPGFPSENNKYRLDNPWGHFLWWRERFFE